NGALVDLPADLRVSTHICRGNYHSTWAAKGGYGPVAKYVFAKENVSAFYLEFDDERSGGFEPLQEVSGGKEVVLGLVTSKQPELEAAADLVNRIKEASQYVSLDDLALSTQCGFSSTEEGNRLTEEDQWNKLNLVIDTAKSVWKD
ncbi:5-methyltetrahydropteroyltriglutamate--homocysteine methyltransferase, partial [Limosilactobacillus fermentum]